MVDVKFKTIPISEVQVKLPKLKRQVQIGRERLVVTCYGEVVGFLLPLSDVSPENGLPINCWREISLTQFRQQLSDAMKLIGSDVDCIYLTFHTRRIIAFVSRHLAPYLPILVIVLS